MSQHVLSVPPLTPEMARWLSAIVQSAQIPGAQAGDALITLLALADIAGGRVVCAPVPSSQPEAEG
jgi:hypothetical protein